MCACVAAPLNVPVTGTGCRITRLLLRASGKVCLFAKGGLTCCPMLPWVIPAAALHGHQLCIRALHRGAWCGPACSSCAQTACCESSAVRSSPPHSAVAVAQSPCPSVLQLHCSSNKQAVLASVLPMFTGRIPRGCCCTSSTWTVWAVAVLHLHHVGCNSAAAESFGLYHCCTM
jgi:hypothetical protein